ncbi:S1C family serine protease [Miltoncostaea oceani]|uniref:S1C family serine protease n=1 Tax=Miltoncostaea oceani TaxID=2843216 RepID=UPI001C3DF0E6|nr:trypsin-like peptidase domain-containing protein [Miltoncostaea oceani]
MRQALRGGAARTAAIALSAAAIGGGVVAATDLASDPGPATATASPATAASATSVARTTTAAGAATTVDFSAVYAARRAGVVSVTATVAAGAGAPGAPGGGEATATGSGVVIDDEGHVLTNEHVVDGARAVSVELADGTTTAATVVGTDPSTDLAVLDIDVPADALDPIPLGDASTVDVGDPVLAVGDPFGYQASASAGIVSGLDRSIQAPNGFTITGAVQTDAAVNHGNSGGALLDANGELVGIPAQIADSGVDANVGVAFAIPVDTARRVIDGLLADGRVDHAWLGVTTATVDANLAGTDGVGADTGALITGVVAGGPADDAGLAAGDTPATDGGAAVCVGGDVVTAIGDREVTDAATLQEAVDALAPGTSTTLTVVGPGGEPRTVDVTLGSRPATTSATPAATCG